MNKFWKWWEEKYNRIYMYSTHKQIIYKDSPNKIYYIRYIEKIEMVGYMLEYVLTYKKLKKILFSNGNTYQELEDIINLLDEDDNE